MGFALGCVHLSFDDFCGCTPEEFESICEAYHDQREADYKDEWERMRMLAAIVIQPHVKQRVTPGKLLPFPWENPAGQHKKAPELTAAESLKRFEELAKKVEI
nr:MAG TPA: hypothetical protein [Caudoviricetes sp.]